MHIESVVRTNIDIVSDLMSAAQRASALDNRDFDGMERHLGLTVLQPSRQ